MLIRNLRNSSMAEIHHQTVIADRQEALDLIEAAIAILNQKPLEILVKQLLTPAHKAGLSAMAVSGDEPNQFGQFLVLCEYYGLVTNEEVHKFIRRFVAASRVEYAEATSDAQP
jgi:hypothetical protein